MDVILVGSWMLFSERIRPWTSSCLGHGCSSPKRPGWIMDALLRTGTSSWLGHGQDHDLFLYTDSAGRLNKASQLQKQQAPLCESLQKASNKLTKKASGKKDRKTDEALAKASLQWKRRASVGLAQVEGIQKAGPTNPWRSPHYVIRNSHITNDEFQASWSSKSPGTV